MSKRFNKFGKMEHQFDSGFRIRANFPRNRRRNIFSSASEKCISGIIGICDNGFFLGNHLHDLLLVIFIGTCD